MGIGLIQRVIFWDLIKITLLALVGVSLLLTLIGVMVEATRHGLDPLKMLAVVPYLIPRAFPYTLPTCMLFACTVVFSGMSSSNEITALKAGGVHPLRFLLPPFVLSVAVSVLGVGMADRFIPYCNRTLSHMILSDLEASLYAYLKQQGSIADPNFPYEIHAPTVRDGKLINPIFKHRTPQGPWVIQASEATLTVKDDPKTGLPLIHFLLSDGVVSTNEKNMIYFREREQQIPVPDSIMKKDDKTVNLTFQGCQDKANEREQVEREQHMQVAHSGVMGFLRGDVAAFTRVLPSYEATAFRMHRKSREARAEVHIRIAQSAAAIGFVMLGVPLTILSRRKDFLHSFFLCFLPIITLYYPAMILSFNIFKEGKGDMFFTLWGPTMALVVIALPFLRNVIRY